MNLETRTKVKYIKAVTAVAAIAPFASLPVAAKDMPIIVRGEAQLQNNDFLTRRAICSNPALYIKTPLCENFANVCSLEYSFNNDQGNAVGIITGLTSSPIATSSNPSLDYWGSPLILADYVTGQDSDFNNKFSAKTTLPEKYVNDYSQDYCYGPLQENTLSNYISNFDEKLINIYIDKSVFEKAIKEAKITKPNLNWTTEEEAGFEWYFGETHAFVILEGDGIVRYTMDINDRFVSGKDQNAKCDRIPEDLIDYLKSI